MVLNRQVSSVSGPPVHVQSWALTPKRRIAAIKATKTIFILRVERKEDAVGVTIGSQHLAVSLTVAGGVPKRAPKSEVRWQYFGA